MCHLIKRLLKIQGQEVEEDLPDALRIFFQRSSQGWNDKAINVKRNYDRQCMSLSVWTLSVSLGLHTLSNRIESILIQMPQSL